MDEAYYMWMYDSGDGVLRVPVELSDFILSCQSLFVTKHSSIARAKQFIKKWKLEGLAKENDWVLCKVTIEVINEEEKENT